MRRAARVDENHLEIVEALHKSGASVTSLAGVGRGVPDLLVSYRGSWHVLEIKDGRKRPSARRLRPAQFAWMQEQRAPVHVVESVDDALAAVGAAKPTWQQQVAAAGGPTWRETMGDDA